MMHSTLFMILQTSVLAAAYTAPAAVLASPQTVPAQIVTSNSAQRVSAVFNATPLADALSLLQEKTRIIFEIANPAEARAPVSAVIEAKPLPEAIKIMLEGYAYVLQAQPDTPALKLFVYSAPSRSGAVQAQITRHQDQAQVKVTQAQDSDDDEDEDEMEEQIAPVWR